MARSFYRPSGENIIEDYETKNRFYHAPSRRHYRMVRRDGQFFQQRYQLDARGNETHLFEQEVTYIIGSGNHSRSYLNLSAGGVLTQLPVSWYAEEKRWGISPGYDRARHHDFSRKIDYGCMFCHNAYPKLEEGADRYGRENLFPQDLPLGIDCQRCHGPGSRHVALAVEHGQDIGAVRNAIVDPARLTPERQMDVCQQCHLETTSDELPQAVRRFGRSVYSFRPGEVLASYLVHFDHAPGTGHDGKFEINSSAYRLRKSACFQKSQGQLTCVTCHNPHHTEKGEVAVGRFRDACLKCHAEIAAKGHPRAGRRNETSISAQNSDCSKCHMAKRRTEDVIHVVMTDHWIQRHPPARNLVASLREDHALYRGEVVFYSSKTESAGSADPAAEVPEIYWAIAQVKQQSNLQAGLIRFKSLVEKDPPSSPEPWVELALAEIEAGALRDAKNHFKQALDLDPGLVPAHYNLGRVGQLLGQAEEAAAHYRRALQLDPGHSEALNNLGIILQGQQHLGAAREHFEKAAVRNPVFVDAYNNLGNVLASQQRWDDAQRQFQAALRVDPANADAYNNLARLAGARGDLEQAIRYFGQAVDADPKHWIARLNLARALEAAGRSREARAAYREAKRLNPILQTEKID